MASHAVPADMKRFEKKDLSEFADPFYLVFDAVARRGVPVAFTESGKIRSDNVKVGGEIFCCPYPMVFISAKSVKQEQWLASAA